MANFSEEAFKRLTKKFIGPRYATLHMNGAHKPFTIIFFLYMFLVILLKFAILCQKSVILIRIENEALLFYEIMYIILKLGKRVFLTTRNGVNSKIKL